MVRKKHNIMDKIEQLNLLNSLEIGNEKYKTEFDNFVLNDLSGSEKDTYEYLKRIKKIKDNSMAQDRYIQMNGHRKILRYNVETFMPIYEGIAPYVNIYE